MTLQRTRIHARLAVERGTLTGQGRRQVALVYPSPYGVGMSSLGYQEVYRRLNALPDTVAERAFVPDDGDPDTEPLLTYESLRPIGDFPIVAFSVAYELELVGVFRALTASRIPLLREARGEREPWVVMGGPLTFSNPLPLAPFADVIVMGEAEELLAPLVDTLSAGLPKAEALRALAQQPGFYVPSLHGDALPQVAQCDDTLLPARSAIVTPDTALANMFLLETERGCSRGCTFCVMRRSTNGGMRVIPKERVLAAIPSDVEKVGLVGAAVSDHPRIVPIVQAIVDSGKGVSLSSLRADRLTPDFVAALAKGGGKTLTVASDGASERLRAAMEKKIREKHLLRAAELARDAGMTQLKNYMMVGVPGETDADLDELIRFTLEQARVAGPKLRVSLGVATFVSKRNTPLAGAPFVGIKEAERRLEKLRRGLMPRVVVRPVSARWAWVEYVLANGGPSAGLRALTAWQNGGSFAAWKRAFAEQGTDDAPMPAFVYDGATGFPVTA